MSPRKTVTLERTYRAAIDDVWDLWTTKEGIESWWGPDGFSVKVESIDLRPGGEMRYTMIASGPEQVAFMKREGMPLATPHRITYTAIEPRRRLAYTQLADFIPGVEAYDVAMVITFTVAGDSVRMVLTTDVMHDQTWTERMTTGWEMELEKLAAALAA